MNPSSFLVGASILGATLLLAGSGLQEQGPPARPDAAEARATAGRTSGASGPEGQRSATLHRAWLEEVLDLDPIAAARDYAEVARDDRPGHYLRWVAAARLVELHRLDLASSIPVDTTDVPSVLRSPFDEADQTLEVHTLLRQLEGDPTAVIERLASEQGQLPDLRPLVAATERWVVDQTGPTRPELVDRSRRRRIAYGQRAPFYDRLNAKSVLRAELDGKREVADERRSIHFTLWKPPVASRDPAEDLRRFRVHIQQLVDNRSWGGDWLEQHRRLRDEVERRAALDPADAVTMLRRLPYYAELLLAPVSPEEQGGTRDDR